MRNGVLYSVPLRLANNTVKVVKNDPKKPTGKMSAYYFSVQLCREGHKKKILVVPVNFVEFSNFAIYFQDVFNFISPLWKTMSGKEKSKFNEMAKADKVCYNWEMKEYGLTKGSKKRKDHKFPNIPLSGFFLFCSEFFLKIKDTNLGISIGDEVKKPGRDME
jgi:high mobility group protein B3